MKKADIITLHTVSNYGSCLQTYATQRIFEQCGWEAEIIDYYRKDNTPDAAVDRMFESSKLKKLSMLWKKMPILKKLASIPLKSIVSKQRKPFDDFRKKYLNLTEVSYFSEEQLESNPPIADLYCTGSDQVWNSIWNKGFEKPFYLEFAPEGKPRIAFAASIGRESIDDWEIEPMRKALSRYSSISMRETSGLEIVRSLGCTDAHLVLDPTLMLTRDEWAKIATMPSNISGDYILVYQLNKNNDFVEYSKKLSERLGIPLVKISYGLYDVQKSANTLVAPRVTDFIGLFLNAKYVLTDSFHATAYSLNFNKPFISVAPSRFSTRIVSILDLVHEPNRLLQSYSDLDLMQKPIDFENVNAILNSRRHDSLMFLKHSLAYSEQTSETNEE